MCKGLVTFVPGQIYKGSTSAKSKMGTPLESLKRREFRTNEKTKQVMYKTKVKPYLAMAGGLVAKMANTTNEHLNTRFTQCLTLYNALLV